MAKIKRKSDFVGGGCLIQGIGLVLLLIDLGAEQFFPIGTIVGIGLIIFGSINSVKFVCSECGNKIDSRGVKLCPTCKADFRPTSEKATFEPDTNKQWKI